MGCTNSKNVSPNPGPPPSRQSQKSILYPEVPTTEEQPVPDAPPEYQFQLEGVLAEQNPAFTSDNVASLQKDMNSYIRSLERTSNSLKKKAETLKKKSMEKKAKGDEDGAIRDLRESKMQAKKAKTLSTQAATMRQSLGKMENVRDAQRFGMMTKQMGDAMRGINQFMGADVMREYQEERDEALGDADDILNAAEDLNYDEDGLGDDDLLRELGQETTNDDVENRLRNLGNPSSKSPEPVRWRTAEAHAEMAT